MGEPDDPLRADDALVGAEHEDVLLDSGGADEGEPAAEYAGSVPDDDEHPTSVAVLDDRPTTELPAVVGPAPAPPGRWAGVAPWGVFAAVAVVVIAATSTWAAWLQGPTAERQGFTGLIQPPTATAAAPPPAEAAPAPSPSAEPQPEPEPEPEPVARPTQRPRATKTPAPPPPRPPAAAVNAPATPDGGTTEEPAPQTSAPKAPAAAEAGAADRDGEPESADADKSQKDEDEDSESGSEEG